MVSLVTCNSVCPQMFGVCSLHLVFEAPSFFRPAHNCFVFSRLLGVSSAILSYPCNAILLDFPQDILDARDCRVSYKKFAILREHSISYLQSPKL